MNSDLRDPTINLQVIGAAQRTERERAADLVAPLRRRWYVLLLGLVVTAALAFAVARQSQASYQAEASVVLLPGPEAIPERGNPFLYLGGIVLARDVVLRSINAYEVREEITAGFEEGADYAATADPSTSGPVLVVVATGPSEEKAVQVRRAVLSALPGSLTGLQDAAGIAEGARIRAVTLTDGDPVRTDTGAMLRSLVVVVVIGGALTVLLAGAYDSIALSRQRKMRAKEPEQGSLGPVPSAKDSDAPEGTTQSVDGVHREHAEPDIELTVPHRSPP